MGEVIKPFIKNRPSVQGPQTGAAPGTATLPPAGHARNEELKRRTDRLEEQAAHELQNVESIDPTAMEIERELAGHFNELEVQNADPAFVYKWVNFVSNNGIALRQATAPPERWEIVTGTMKEAEDLKAIDGTRKLGDVLLLRMPRKRYEILEKVRADKAALQQQGYENNLLETGRRHGIKVYRNEDMPENAAKRMQNPSQAAVNAMRGAMAASDKFDQSLRTGAI